MLAIMGPALASVLHPRFRPALALAVLAATTAATILPRRLRGAGHPSWSPFPCGIFHRIPGGLLHIKVASRLRGRRMLYLLAFTLAASPRYVGGRGEESRSPRESPAEAGLRL